MPRGTGPDKRSGVARAAQIRARAGRDRIVLIVDDDDGVASSTALLLEVEGYRPITAADFDGARDRLPQIGRAPDLIICDYHLRSGPSGVETIQMIRKVTQRSIPAFLVTGDTSHAAHDLADQLAKCHLLNKPIRGDELLGLLQDQFE